MIDTHQSYLEKQNAIYKKEIESMQKRKNFNDEFILYGEKNNQKVK